jgi:choline monooxygenase
VFEDYEPTPDLARARTIPSRWYLEPEFLDRERSHIFRRSWQWVGRTSDVRSPGDFFTTELAGEPVVIARGSDGKLRAFSNVCRHRAGPVAEGRGSRAQFQCAYHGWIYALDGRLRRAAEMDGVEDFAIEDICLPRFTVAEWPPLVFVKLGAEGPSLEDTFDGIQKEVEAADFALDALDLVERRDYVVESNWKVYVDNYLEGYHIPHIHPALFKEVDYERYRVETKGYYSSQIAPLRADKQAQRVYPPRSEDERALYYWVFPNLMLNFYPGNLQANAIVPLDPEHTLTVFEWYAHEGVVTDALRSGIELSEQVQREDMDICQKVHAGLRSQTYDTGRLSPRRENGVHHFHRLLHEFLTRP